MKINPFDLKPSQEVRLTAKELLETYEAGVFAGAMDYKGGKLYVDCDLAETTMKQRRYRKVGKYGFWQDELCLNCGAELLIWHKYCPLCGAKITGMIVDMRDENGEVISNDEVDKNRDGDIREPQNAVSQKSGKR